MRNCKRYFVLALLLGASMAIGAAPTSKINLIVNFGKRSVNTTVKSVSFDHAGLKPRSPKAPPKPLTDVEFTIKLGVSAAVTNTFKPKAIIPKIDLVLSVFDPAGRQHFRSQIELAEATVGAFTLSADKKTATIVVTAKMADVSEQTPTTNGDWVAAG